MHTSKLLRKVFQVAMCALVLAVLLPVTALAQRTWVVVRPHRSRVVVYQRPYVVYQRRPYYRTYSYGYSPYYTNSYYSYGYSQPYYSSGYYSYRYSQPYFANRYTYSWANPSCSYNDDWYRDRHRHHRTRARILLR